MRRTIALAALALLLATPAPAPAAPAAARLCEKSGTSVAGSAQVRVYERKGRVIACSLENGRRLLLGRRAGEGGSSGVSYVSPLVVAGRMVAWQANRVVSTEPSGERRFAIANLHSGRVRVDRALPDPGVTEVVLRPNGSAAWIEQGRSGAARALHRRDANGEAVIAQGEIDRLGVSERATLYWTEGGTPRSAILEPAAAAAAPKKDARLCGGRGELVAMNPWVRVWDRDVGDFWGCSVESKRRVELGFDYASGQGATRNGPFAIAHRLVARYETNCFYIGPRPPGDCDQAVELIDMRTGKRRTLGKASGVLSTEEELVLHRSGAAAWLDASGVHVADADGDRSVGRGSDLALGAGPTVYWTDPAGEVPHSVALR